MNRHYYTIGVGKQFDLDVSQYAEDEKYNGRHVIIECNEGNYYLSSK